MRDNVEVDIPRCHVTEAHVAEDMVTVLVPRDLVRMLAVELEEGGHADVAAAHQVDIPTT